ncbi:MULTISPECIES: hypothetical protein [unclassified Mycobacterium]|uniref:hypothetical protein n=1 Tax=unclassified Mycobacterium TaxID=2642494 RepID=UPI000A660D62|nr:MULTISPECIES: hypothetical protein [unclassified Mycobacterium]
MSDFDYIIVGAGSAGPVLANSFAGESPVSGYRRSRLTTCLRRRTHMASYTKPESVEFLDALQREAGQTGHEVFDEMFGRGGVDIGT